MDEIPKYRKKAKKNTPKKSKHKHIYEPCVFEYHVSVPWNPQATNKTIGSYCRICGKMGSMMDRERWIEEVHNSYGYFPVWTKEAEAEFDKKTRTLPYYFINGLFTQKYVEVEGVGE